MSQETVRFSSSAWRAVGATIASQGSQGQASPAQEEAPAASLTPATDSADSFLRPPCRLYDEGGVRVFSLGEASRVAVRFARLRRLQRQVSVSEAPLV